MEELNRLHAEHLAKVEAFLLARFKTPEGMLVACEQGYALAYLHPAYAPQGEIVWDHSLQHPDGTLEPIAKTVVTLKGGPTHI